MITVPTRSGPIFVPTTTTYGSYGGSSSMDGLWPLMVTLIVVGAALIAAGVWFNRRFEDGDDLGWGVFAAYGGGVVAALGVGCPVLYGAYKLVDVFV